MPKKRPFRVSRSPNAWIEPGSYGRNSNLKPLSAIDAAWVGRMQASQAGAQEVMVKITGGGRDADGVQAHMEYIDRHGKLDLETDHGEALHGKEAATQLVNDWGIGYGVAAGGPHSRRKVTGDGPEKRQGPRQAFNIILSMPPGTPPEKVLQAAKKFARENFANQHRYAMALHADMPEGHGKHPHVHLVVKAEHEYGGKRLNPRKADLRRWREQFAACMTELGVAATATRRQDRGLGKTQKKDAIYRAAQRDPKPDRASKGVQSLYTEAGDSVFMRKKLEAVKKDLRAFGSVEDQGAYRALLDVRDQVSSRYRDAVTWLRGEGREEEARRFELALASLPPVRTERQQLAEQVFGVQRPPLAPRDPSEGERPRGR